MIHKVRWTAQKIAQRLRLIEPLVYRQSHALPPFRYVALSDPWEVLPSDHDGDGTSWLEIQPHTYWGQWMTDFVLSGQFQAPGDWDSEAQVALYLPLGDAGDFTHPEALVHIDGEPFGTVDRYHHEVLLPSHWRSGQTHRLLLHGWTGFCSLDSPKQGSQLLMGASAVVQIDQPTRDFIATARVALGVAESLDDDQPAKGHLLNALDEAFKLLDIREPLGEAFYTSIPQAQAALQAGLGQAGQPMDIIVVATGHAHLDVAWLWTVGQIRRKAGRTFHNVLRLMEQFPDFHFTQSQPQLYDFLQKDYPELFTAIKRRVVEGRWEPIGGMWVEADCNLSGPESLARQFLLGRTFYKEHFGEGADSPVLWLPDVFGYAWALPQLIKQAGLDYFFTIKIGWSQYNRLPYDSFWWQGLDGTRVLTHFSTTPDAHGYGNSTYNAEATPWQALGTWRNFQQKESQHSLLMAYGYGDGGGGPTREMLENIREMAAFPAIPRVRQGSVGDFFRNLEANSGESLPTWNGELYLELHRGTYTTQSRNKRANRQSEFLLHDAEFLAAFAALMNPDYHYPAETLRKAWEVVCLNQFHDIIPGSSIGPVYEESLQQYADLKETIDVVRTEALAAIDVRLPWSDDRDASARLLVVNPTSFPRDELAFWPGQLSAGEQLLDPDGNTVPVQETEAGTLLAMGELAPYSVTSLVITQSPVSDFQPPDSNTLTADPTLLENAYLQVELNEAGDIIRIYDKANRREVLPPGAIANQFQAFEDLPLFWDAWDVEIFYDDKMWTSEPAESVRVVEAGPLRATLEIRRRILNSKYTQRISLAYNQSSLDFDTNIDWRERHILLKVAFPVDILSPVATYEIQWGQVQRPTHQNTSWDWARFETCAQKWVDLSEGGYGVSLLNDCKYGHDVRDQTPQGGVMRISLLRSPTSPDPEADQGEQQFAYSLLPHLGGVNERTVSAAYAFNDPLLVYATREMPQKEDTGIREPAGESMAGGESSLLHCDSLNIVIETIKIAEDGNGMIVRLYESQRKRGPVYLHAGFNLSAAWRTNLLEENQEKLPINGKQVNLSVRPFEIVTLRLVTA